MGRHINNCEKALAELLCRKHCVLTGNGTSALRIAYSLAKRSRTKVLLPALVCLNPMLAAHFAGKMPLFADVLKSDATIDPESVSAMLEKDPDIAAVVAVHLYGHSTDMKRLEAICARHDVMLIEDLAQALGGTLPDGRPSGSAGDCSVVSFGYAKILDAGGGGAFLTDDDALAGRARFLSAALGKRCAAYGGLHAIYRKLYYAIWESGQIDSRFYRMFDLFPVLFEKGLVYGISDAQAKRILNSLGMLEKESAVRRKIAAQYQEELGGFSHIKFFTPRKGFVPWRFTFRVNKARRQDLVTKLRSAGYDVSCWYPSITEWTPSGREQKKESFPVSNMIEKEVLNLWVTRDYDGQRASSLVRLIKRSLI